MFKKRSILKNIIGLFSLIFVVALLTACSSADDWDSDEAAAESINLATAPESIDREPPGNVADEEAEEGALGSIPILLPSESGRQLAYTVDFNLQTTEFMPGMRALLDTVGEMGGYSETVVVNGRCLRQPYVERNAYFVFRIPNQQISAFLVFIEDNYNWLRLDKRLIDFTFAYERNVDGLEALREQEQRLLGELDNDEDEDNDTKRDDLADIRAQIRDLEESNTIIGYDVDYSDVTIRLSEVIILEEESETFGEQLQDRFSGAVQIIVLIMVTLLPWGLMTALIVVPIVYAVKRGRKKNGKDEMLGGR